MTKRGEAMVNKVSRAEEPKETQKKDGNVSKVC